MNININLGQTETQILWDLKKKWKIGTERVIARLLRRYTEKTEPMQKATIEPIGDYRKIVEEIHHLLSDYEKFRVNAENQRFAIKQTITNKYGSLMYRCSSCGKDVFGQDSFCRHCGRKF